MTIARRQLIDAETTPFYHIICRCVRRAFLCGVDDYDGRDYSHRRAWIEEKLSTLGKVFAIDIASYAIMSNHFHLVLHIDSDLANSWNLEELFTQYSTLHGCHTLVQQYLEGVVLTPAQMMMMLQLAETYRERLSSISWFMKILNQSIALRANKEDNCTGKFWESRFKSQALLDETALLTCMTYVDLNPIRANVAKTPETSDYTSIQARLGHNQRNTATIRDVLLEFMGKKQDYGDKRLPISEKDYFTLVDWTGRCVREDKRGSIPTNIPPILERINLTQHEWLRHTQFFEARFKRVAGTLESIQRAASQFKQKWFHSKPPKPIPI